MTKISREALYERVWQTPMRSLAAEYGISDQGLAKICARHNIPRPPRGYWAKQAAGHAVRKTPLPDQPSGGPDTINIHRAAPAIGVGIAVTKATREQSATLPAITVPGDLRGMHKIVAAWIEEHAQEQAKRRAELKAWRDRYWTPEPLRNLTERDRYRFRMTSALLKAVETHGGKALSGTIRGELVIEMSGEKIELTVMEKMRQTLTKPTEEDKNWTAYPHQHNAALHPTGFLRVTVNTYFGGGTKKQWIETDKLNGSEILAEVVAGLTIIGTALIHLRQEREEAHRKFELEQQRRAELRRLEELDKQRWERFRKLAVDWEEAKRLRAFLSAIEEGYEAVPLEIDGLPRDEWLEWARRKIAKLDPLSPPKAQS